MKTMLSLSYARKIDASVIISVTSFAGGLLSVVPMVMVTAIIGLGPVTDAYMLALYITSSMTKVLRLGILQKIFTTRFAQVTVAGTIAHVREPISNLINVCIIVLVPFTMVMIGLAPYLFHIVAPGFAEPTKQMATEMVRLLLSLILYHALEGLFVGLLNGCQRFILAALAGVLPPMIVALAAVFGLPRFGIYALMWGHIVGSFIHLVVLYVGMVLLGFRHSPVLRFRDQDLRRTLKLLSPFYVGILAVEVRRLLTMVVLGSMLGEGRFSALMLATHIIEYISRHVFGPVMRVAYPSLVRHAGESTEQMREYMIRILRILNYLVLPLLALLVVFSTEIVQVLFYRGKFDERDVSDVALVLIIRAVGLIPKGLYSVFDNALFALERTGWMNVFLVTSQFGVTALSFLLFPFYGIGGIAAANACSTTLLVFQQALYLGRKFAIGDIVADRVSLKIVCLGLVVGGAAYGSQHIFGGTSSPIWWMQIGNIVLATVPAVLLYVVLSRCFKIGELGLITTYLTDRLQIKRWMLSTHWPRAKRSSTMGE
jgi:putative peptidoglycan lipid II flippase